MHGVAQRYLGAEFYFQCTCINEWLCLLILILSLYIHISGDKGYLQKCLFILEGEVKRGRKEKAEAQGKGRRWKSMWSDVASINQDIGKGLLG